jgi:hypothetical protein
MSYIALSDKINSLYGEEAKLVKELDGYLKNIDKNSR